MLDMKQAAKNALEFVEDLYEGKGILDRLMLEEIELSEDEKYWNITVGYDSGRIQTVPNQFTPIGLGSTTTKPNRVYKSVKVDADTGKVLSLKIRNV